MLLVAGCAGADGSDRGLIRENVIEPGITAIEEARDSACGLNAQTLQTAIEAYTLLVGDPPPDETALVDEGYLREETSDWNVVDGQLVAENPACGEVPAAAVSTTPPVDTSMPPVDTSIPSDAGQPLDGAAIYERFTPAEVADMGGPECARQVGVLIAASNSFGQAEGRGPETLVDLEVGGHLTEVIDRWLLVDATLRPAPGSNCRDFVAAFNAEQLAETCKTEFRTISIASEAYAAEFGAGPENRDVLVEAGYFRDDTSAASFTVTDGVISAVPGGQCDGIEVSGGTGTIDPDECDARQRTLEVAVEAFIAVHGEAPTAVIDLFNDSLIREAWTTHELDANGTIVAVASGPCG